MPTAGGRCKHPDIVCTFSPKLYNFLLIVSKPGQEVVGAGCGTSEACGAQLFGFGLYNVRVACSCSFAWQLGIQVVLATAPEQQRSRGSGAWACKAGHSASAALDPLG